MPFGMSDVTFDISATGQDAQAAIDGVKSEFNSMTDSADEAGNAVDDFGDEASSAASETTELAVSANRAASQVDELGDEASGAAGRMTAFAGATSAAKAASLATSAAFTVSLIPAAITLASTMGPLVGVLGGVATALGGLGIAAGAVVLGGVIAGGKELQQQMKATRKEIKGVVSAFGQQFVPLIKDALDALPTLVKRVLDSINGLGKMQKALRDLGSFAMTAIPKVVDVMTRIGVEALPEIRALAEYIATNAGPAFRQMKSAAEAVYPSLKQLALAFADLGPPLLDFGTAATNVLIPALTKIVQGLSLFLKAVRVLPGPVKDVVAAVSLLAPPALFVASKIFGLTAALGGFSTALSYLLGPIGLVITALVALGAAWKKNLFGIQSQTKQAFSAISGRIQTFITQVRTKWKTFTTALADEWGMVNKIIVNTIKRMVGDARQAIAAGMAMIKAVWRGDTQAIVNAWNLMIRQVKQILASGMEGLRNTVVYGMTAIIKAFDSTFKKFPTSAALAIQDVANVILTGMNALLEQFLGFRTDSKESWKITLAAWENLTKVYVPRIKQAIAGMLTGLRKDIVSFKKRIVKVWKGIWPLLPKPVQKASQKIWKAWQTIGKRLVKRGQKTVQKLKQQWVKQGPKIRTQISKIGTTIKNGLLKRYKSLNGRSGKLRKQMTKLWKGVKTALKEAWKVIKPPLVNLAKRLGYINQEGKLTKKAIDDLGLALVGLATGPIGSLVVAAVKLWKAFQNNFLNIKTHTMNILNTIRTFIGKKVKQIQRVWNQNIIPIYNTVKKRFNQVKRIITNVVNGILKNVIRPVLRSIRKQWAIHGEAIMKEVRILWKNMKNAWNRIKNIIKGVMNFITNILRVGWNVVETIVKTAMKFIEPLIRTAFKGIKATIRLAINAIMTWWRHFGDEIQAITRFLFDAVGSIINTAVDGFLTSIRVFLNILNGDWEGAWNAIRNYTERLLGGIVNFLDKWITGFLGSIGGFVNSVKGWFRDLSNGVGGIVDSWLNGIQRSVDGAVSSVSSSISGFVDGVVSDFRSLKNDAQRAVDNLLSHIEGLSSSFSSAGSALISSLKSGINSNLPIGMSVPKITVGKGVPGPDHTIGGQSISIPKLDVGGQVTSTGMAMIHKGEEIVPAGVDKGHDGGGGDTYVKVDVDARGADDPDEVATSVSNELRSVFNY